VYLLVTVMILLGTLIYLWPRMRLVNLGYQQGALHVRRTKAVQAHKELQAELATLRQLSRIETIARQRLGMRPAHMSQIIYVHPGPRLVVPGERR
jgi:cell division protein FtsL